jgi:glycerol-3-phosphate O-acyltransferase
LLAERIEARYVVENVVLSSHLVAYAVFQMLRHENPKLDIFGILRLPSEEFIFPKHAVEDVIEQLQVRLFEMEKQGNIRLDPDIHLEADVLIKRGVKNLGIFHTEKPLVYTKDHDIISSNFRVLYFYHNRLERYNLEKFVHWKSEEIEVLKVD